MPMVMVICETSASGASYRLMGGSGRARRVEFDLASPVVGSGTGSIIGDGDGRGWSADVGTWYRSCH